MLLLPAVLTQHEARDLLRVFRETAGQVAGDELVVDAGALQRFDSSALAVLLACRRQAESARQRFTVRGMPAQLVELARLYGVADLLPADPPPG